MLRENQPWKSQLGSISESGWPHVFTRPFISRIPKDPAGRLTADLPHLQSFLNHSILAQENVGEWTIRNSTVFPLQSFCLAQETAWREDTREEAFPLVSHSIYPRRLQENGSNHNVKTYLTSQLAQETSQLVYSLTAPPNKDIETHIPQTINIHSHRSSQHLNTLILITEPFVKLQLLLFFINFQTIFTFTRTSYLMVNDLSHCHPWIGTPLTSYKHSKNSRLYLSCGSKAKV